MTAPDPRLEETPLAYRPEHQQAATDDLIRTLTESADIPGVVNLPREAVNMLLAELRKAQGAVARVETLCVQTEKGRPMETDCPENWMLDPEDVRAAVADATGGGE